MAAKVKKRLYYKIGEACQIVGIQPYVLRYWETEFPALSPTKSRSGQRVYGEKELALIRRIQQLLYEEGYTIAGAKKKLEAEVGSGEPEEVANGAEATAAERDEPESGGAESERLARLETGVRAALAEARQILALLD